MLFSNVSHSRLNMTNTTRRTFLHTIGATTVFGTATGVATASKSPGTPVSGSGEGTITNLEVFPIREVGGNTFEDRVLQGTATGTLEGSFEQRVSGMVHESGRVVFRGTMTFTGQVADCGEGTITLGVSGRGHVPEPGFPITEASVRVINQAANTVDVTGTGIVSQEGPQLTYSIRYVCR